MFAETDTHTEITSLPFAVRLRTLRLSGRQTQQPVFSTKQKSQQKPCFASNVQIRYTETHCKLKNPWPKSRQQALAELSFSKSEQ